MEIMFEKKQGKSYYYVFIDGDLVGDIEKTTSYKKWRVSYKDLTFHTMTLKTAKEFFYTLAN